MIKILKIFLAILLSLGHLIAANSVITIGGTGTSSTSAHITVTSAAKLCPDEYVVESGASLTTWDPSAVCGASISGGGDVNLPVTLSAFKADIFVGVVQLYWRTESEIENVGFILKRSENEEAGYQEIASYLYNDNLRGHFNSNTSHEYSFMDEDVKTGHTYWYKLIDVDINGVKQSHGPLMVKTDYDNVSRDFVLHQNYPNPFNPSTTIQFSLPRPGQVELTIYSLSGQRIAIVMSDYLNAETYQVRWNGRDNAGNPVSSGVYLYELKAGTQRISKKMMLLK